ncbi:MAG: DUF1501 domain-containing protein [Planctomycetota bacterium]
MKPPTPEQRSHSAEEGTFPVTPHASSPLFPDRCDRRAFLRIGAGSVAGAAFLPGSLPAWVRSAADSPTETRTLILLELNGGNDGLNTVIPIENDLYHRVRPTLRVPRSDGFALEDGFALHPSLSELHELFTDGKLSILHGVGYPQPDRSHFRSLDIWHSARPNLGRPDSGWIGRLADTHAKDGDIPALRIGRRDLPLLLRGHERGAPCITSIEDWRLDLGSNPSALRPALENALAAPRSTDSASDLEFVRRVAQRAVRESDRFAKDTPVATPDRSHGAGYPDTALGRNLSLARTLIDSASRPRVIFVSHDGFDTHSRQRDPHANLLRELSTALGAFMNDLVSRDLDRDVLVCVYSEFGRRVAENASGGTDHGAAQPVLLVSGALQGGCAGTAPALTDLDQGDLRYTCDFRRLYATFLDRWWALPAAGVLDGEFAPIDGLLSAK